MQLVAKLTYLDRANATMLRVIPLSGEFGFTRHGDITRQPLTINCERPQASAM
jgi:hypothetical protein